MTLADVADVLNISVRQATSLVQSGELPGIKIGGRGIWRIEHAKLEEYIARAYRSTAETLGLNPDTVTSTSSH